MMNEYKSVFFKYIKYTLYLLSLLFIGYAVTPYKTIFLGLALGTLFSLYNLWSMYSVTCCKRCEPRTMIEIWPRYA